LKKLLIPVLAFAATALACGDDDGGASSAEQIARGRYLVNDVMLCPFCHTPRRADGVPDPTRFLSGVDCFYDAVPDDDNSGCFHTRNLTDHETGLANATDAEIKNAIINGIGVDGRNLIPVMPYWLFHNLTDADADAIVAYLRTVPGVDHETPQNQPPWLEPDMVYPALTDAQIPMPVSDYPEMDAALRGRYLSTVGTCIDCHTAEMTPGALDFDFTKAFGGGRIWPADALGYPSPPFPPFIYTSNLTPDETGLAGYTHADIVKVMKEGVTPDKGMGPEGVCAPTHSGPSSPYAGLTDEDLSDIAHYLLSLPPVVLDPVTVTTPPPDSMTFPVDDCVGPLP